MFSFCCRDHEILPTSHWRQPLSLEILLTSPSVFYTCMAPAFHTEIFVGFFSFVCLSRVVNVINLPARCQSCRGDLLLCSHIVSSGLSVDLAAGSQGEKVCRNFFEKFSACQKAALKSVIRDSAFQKSK